MVDTLKLKEVLLDKGIAQKELAESIGMKPSTFHKKIEGKGASFTIGDIQRMVQVIPLTKDEAAAIFLAL